MQLFKVRTNGAILRLELQPDNDAVDVNIRLSHVEARALVAAIEDALAEPGKVIGVEVSS